jgi:uncharacterized membrane protein
MLRAFVVLLCLGPWIWTTHAQAQCGDSTCLTASTRPLTVTLSESNLLDSVLSSLLGVSVDLTAGDYQVLAAADLSVGDLLDVLSVELALGTPQAVLDAEITVAQLLDAAATVATIDHHRSRACSSC